MKLYRSKVPEPIGHDQHECRVYDAVLGRFLAADFTQDYNRYAYAWNNPMMYVDPSGEQDTYPGGYLPPKSDPWNQPRNPGGGAYPGVAGPGFNNGLGSPNNGYGGLIVFGGILIYDFIYRNNVC